MQDRGMSFRHFRIFLFATGMEFFHSLFVFSIQDLVTDAVEAAGLDQALLSF